MRTAGAWVLLCACVAVQAASAAAEKPCSCSGVWRRTADCSHRDRSSFDRRRDLCRGRTATLDLSHNAFRAFPPALGAYVTSVNVSHNQLTALPRAPPLNPETHTLDASSNRIANASDELHGLSALQVLAVQDNLLPSLGFLPTACALRRLSAQRNRLRRVPVELRRCAQLRALDLSSNPLGPALPPGALSALAQLEHLHLARAQLQRLDASSFIGLQTLTFLNLAHNALSALPVGALSPLKRLKVLNLDNNTISELPENAFKGLADLELLRITENKLGGLPAEIFSPLKNLKSLLLNGNQLTSLPSGVFNGLNELESIDLSRNRLNSLPQRLFAGLRSLRNVALSENNLTSVPSDMLSGVQTLHLLDLHDNRLSALPDGLFAGEKSIKVLDLSRNRFASFDAARSLAGLQRVNRLDLQQNRLAAVPAYDASWPSVGKVFVGENPAVEGVSEATLRAWLGRGDRRRALALGASPRLRSLEQLRWALRDDKVLAGVLRGGGDCACGFLKRGYAEVSFCADVRCPGAQDNWMDAVRRVAAPADPVSS